jgi:hypothetical protein
MTEKETDAEMTDTYTHGHHDSVLRSHGAEADAGRYLLGWARAAGFAEIETSSSTWTFADDVSRGWWGDLWSERVTKSAFAQQAVEYGLCARDELERIAEAWRCWATSENAIFIVLHVELIARR